MRQRLTESGKQVSALKAENTQLKQRDKEIKRQKQLVAQYRANPTKDQELAANNLFTMLKHLAESSKQVSALTAENAKLKEEIKELEAR